MKKVLCLAAAAAMLVVSCGKENTDPQGLINSGELVVAAEATDITEHSAVLWGYVNPSELAPGVEVGIILSTLENSSLQNGICLVSSEIDNNNKFFVEAKDLVPGKKYYYKAFINYSGTYRTSDVKNFTTKEFVFAGVDLGLSVKWANANLGASSPADYGGYYQWAGKRDVSNTSIYLDWDNCPYHTGSSYESGWTKYNTQSSYGTVDNKTTLEASDDAAAVNLGGKWRMPTDAEWTELRQSCTWTWTSFNGVEGYMVTSKKNGNSIFLPAAGYREYDRMVGVGSYGGYWSSALYTYYPNNANLLYFDWNSVYGDTLNRYYGLSVRPVSE